ncbi:hypothetical protein ACFXTO_033524 [Malus domestica]
MIEAGFEVAVLWWRLLVYEDAEIKPNLCACESFEDPRDADDAIYGRDGYDFDGVRLRVELAHGGRHSSSDRYRSYSRSSSSRGVSRRSDYRVLVTGLPPSVSWQDPKDHMRRAGDVCFSQVFRDRGGELIKFLCPFLFQIHRLGTCTFFLLCTFILLKLYDRCVY